MSQDGSTAQEDALAELSSIARSEGAVGLYRDRSTDQIVVIVPSSGKSRFHLSDAAPTGLDVRIESRDIDSVTVSAILKDVGDLRSSIPRQWGYGAYLDAQLGKVVIQSDAPEEEFASLESRYPTQIAFRPGTITATSRTWDSPPHWGGAYVTDGVQACTTGFTIKSASGWRVMVTAGHCFPDGAAAYQNAGSMGTVTLDPTWPNPEVEILHGSTYGPYIYTSDTAFIKVVGAADPVVGGQGYCYSGVRTQNRCGFQELDNSATFCPTIFTCSFNMALFGNGPTVPQHGDSGGPFYLPSGGGASIRGMIVGNGCDPFGCHGYAVRYKMIAAYYVMTIATN